MTSPRLAVVLVSDIHAGPDNPYEELRTPGSAASTLKTPHYSLGVLSDAIEKVLEEVPGNRRVLICAGDLSTDCHSIEIERAGKGLTKLADTLRIPKKARFLVPGNHDIDWSMTTLAAQDSWYDGYRQTKVRDVLEAHAKTFVFPTGGKPREVSVAGDQARFYILDSAHEDRKNTNPHRGRLGPVQLQLLDQMLARGVGRFRCVILHHHVQPFAPTHGLADFSILEDSADLIALLTKHSIPFLLHGHQHVPHFIQHVSGAVPLTIVSSGSTTVEFKRLPQDVPNTFHVIVFDDLDAMSPKGIVHTRMFTLTNGWQYPLLTRHSVSARRPFGAPVSPATINAWADEAIALCRTERLVHVDQYLAGKPDGRHVCPHIFRTALEGRIALANPIAEQETIIDANNDRVILQVTGNGGSS